MNVTVLRKGKETLIRFEVNGNPVTLAVSKGRTSKKEVKAIVAKYLASLK